MSTDAQDVEVFLDKISAALGQSSRTLIRAMAEIERLETALMDTVRRVEALKHPCGMPPGSEDALRNAECMSIALAARAAVGPRESVKVQA